MTKREMAERIEKLEGTVTNLESKVLFLGKWREIHRENNNVAFSAICDLLGLSPYGLTINGFDCVQHIGRSGNFNRPLPDILQALYDYLGTELKVEPPVAYRPERVVLVKKAKAGEK